MLLRFWLSIDLKESEEGSTMSDFLVVKDKVQRFAREVYADVRIDSDGDIAIPFEESVVWIRVWEREFDSEDTEAFYRENQLSKIMINIWSFVLVDLKPSQELFKWVATTGQDTIVGHFSLVASDETESAWRLHFSDTIPGATLDPGELKGALLAVAGTTGDAISELKPKFGGKTFFEAQT